MPEICGGVGIETMSLGYAPIMHSETKLKRLIQPVPDSSPKVKSISVNWDRIQVCRAPRSIQSVAAQV